MNPIRLILASSVATLLVAPLASAEVYTWQTGGTSNVWSAAAGDTNWFVGSGSVLSPWGDGNEAVFNAATGEKITVTSTTPLAPTTTTIGANNGSWSFVGSGIIGGTLVKEGTGTLSFGTGTGADAYTGVNTLTGVTINGGTISIGSGGTAGATSNVQALGTGLVTINSGGTLKLWIQNNNAATAPWTVANNLLINGGTVLGEDGINAISGTVEVGANGATLSAKWNNKTLSFTNVISGTGPVVVQRAVGGSGEANATVIMTAKNTYSGGTTINSGILQLGNNVATDSGSVGILRSDITINSTGTLRLSSINALGYGVGTKVNTVNINGGTLLHEANGDNGWGVTYNLTGGTMRSTAATGRFAFGGGTSVNTLAASTSSVIDGNIVLREGNPSPQVLFTVADGAAANDLVVNAAITDNGGGRGIQKDGAGTMVLNGNATYSGGTIVNGGTLALGAGGQLNSSSITVNTGSTFQVLSAGKSVSEIIANDGATLGVVAQDSSTTTVTNFVSLPDGGRISIVPSFASRPATGQTFDLISAAGFFGTGAITTAFDAYGATRVTGTTAVNGAGTALQLTINTGAADLIWNNAGGNNTWDLNTTANFQNGSTSDRFLAADAVTFDDTIGAGDKTITLSGSLAPSLITVNNSAGNYTFNGTGSIVGPGSLVKSGSSTLTLGGTVSLGLTGNVRVNAGTLDLGGKTIAPGSLTMAGGTLATGTVNATTFDIQAGTVSATLAGPGALTKSTAGTAILSANNSYTGFTNVGAGTLQIGAKGTTGALGTGGVFVETGASVKFDRSNNYGNVTNNFSGTGALVFDGVATATATQYALTGDNSGFAGTITAVLGRVGATNAAGNRFGSGELIALGNSTTDSGGQFWLTGGTFANNFTISGLGWLEAFGRGGAIRFGGGTISGNVTLAGNARISAHGSTGAISGNISDGGQGFGLEFGGTNSTGTITLSGANTYTGATTINNATLILNGTLGNTAVTVADANGVIGGHGSIAGSLKFGTSAGGAKLDANATTPGALSVAGALEVVGATPVAVNLTYGASMAMGTPYTVLTYGTTTATAANFTLGNATSFRQGIFAVGNGKVTVDIGSKAITWAGSAGGSWDVGTSTNWVDGQSATEKYFQGDAVTFGNIGAGTITLAAGLTPSSVTVDSTGNYTFNTGTITSPGALTKAGTGTLLLNTQNTFLGGAVVNGGTLAVDGSNGTTRLQNNAQVTVNTGGTLEIRGVNALPSNTNAVDVVVNQGGTLRVVSGNSAVSTATSHAHIRTLTLNGATVDLSYSGTGTSYNNESFQLGTGGLTVSGNTPSSVILSGGATATQAGISLSGSRTFTINDVTTSPAVDFLVGAEIENSDSNNGALVKEGLGTMQLNADTSYTGTTTVNAGTLLVGAGLNGTTGVNVASGASLGGNGTLALGGSGIISVAPDATIAPGLGLGTLTINSANTNGFSVLLLDSGSKFSFELGSGLLSDKIALLNGAAGDISFFDSIINFSDLTNGSLTKGSYTLFTADVVDAYGGLTLDNNGFITGGLTIGAGLEGYLSSSLQLIGNDIVLHVVPEPATVASLAGGVAMLIGMRRRRR